ncbi:MAG: hypothetical protein IT531_02400 [Burkholderiales bacterium]|nr:hypothetical protein [Burkholderiales bacterium]
MRLLVFVLTFALVAGAGLAYDFSRTAVYRATARVSVDPPGAADQVARSQFAIAEAQSLRRSDLAQSVVRRLAAGETNDAAASALERQFFAEALPQTNVIELRAEGPDKVRLTEALSAWIDAYSASRKLSDQDGNTEALAEARHAARVAQRSVEQKKSEMEAFRQRHHITSIERDENPGTARLKGLHAALNDASTREVNAEARLKAVNDGMSQGRGIVRSGDRNAISSLEMRAVDLREKLKELEHDYTAQYLAMDPKFKALKANLARVEQQIDQERERSQKAALIEAQEEYASAQRAAQRIREQAGALKQESQAFSVRFMELKRMAADLDQLQEARRQAGERLAKLESAHKPSAVKIAVLSAPAAIPDPIAPNYLRDALIAVASALGLAISAVWIFDYLRRHPGADTQTTMPPIIQIAYPGLPQPVGASPMALANAAAGLLPALPATAGASSELSAEEISALWGAANADGRFIIVALLAGIAPDELSRLQWKHVHLDDRFIDVPGGSARRLPLLDPIQQALVDRLPGAEADPDAPVLTDATGNPLEEADIDGQLACMAHDSGLRHPEEVTGRSLHFTYAAFLARQGMKMSDLAAMVGRFKGASGAELMRLSPPGRARSPQQVDFIYPSLRPA